MTPGPAAISTRSAVCALEAVRSRLAGRGRITTARLCACPPHPRKPCCDLGRAWYGPGAALVAGDMAVTVRPGGARIGVSGMILTASPPGRRIALGRAEAELAETEMGRTHQGLAGKRQGGALTGHHPHRTGFVDIGLDHRNLGQTTGDQGPQIDRNDTGHPPLTARTRAAGASAIVSTRTEARASVQGCHQASPIAASPVAARTAARRDPFAFDGVTPATPRAAPSRGETLTPALRPCHSPRVRFLPSDQLVIR